MRWSPQQEKALQDVRRWLQYGDAPVFRLFGWAGTGKSELAREINNGVEGDVVSMAFTGKAALVMRKKGLPRASTIHSTIYTPLDKTKGRYEELKARQAKLLAEKARGSANDRDLADVQRLMDMEVSNLNRPAFALNTESLLKGAKLAILDECSMIDKTIGEDLLSFGVKLLVLGDPYQLPPIAGAGFFTEGCRPDVMLTEVHRQARENPIIHMATLVREGRELELGTYGSSRVILPREVQPEMALSANQILVGRNNTRHASNRRFRALKGCAGTFPQKGERVICLRNDHSLGILNGLMFDVVKDSAAFGNRYVDLFLNPEAGMGASEELLQLRAHAGYFQGLDMAKMPWHEKRDAQEFDYGYAITVHKSQGSQWDDTLFFDEWSMKDRGRHVYTGLTRAAERTTVVRMV